MDIPKRGNPGCRFYTMIKKSVLFKIIVSSAGFLSTLFRNADSAIRNIYLNSFFWATSKKAISVSSKFARKLLTGSIVLKMVPGFILHRAPSAIEAVFDLCSRVYYGSIAMNLIGLSVENSRWLRLKS